MDESRSSSKASSLSGKNHHLGDYANRFVIVPSFSNDYDDFRKKDTVRNKEFLEH
jgi:hypothetical protein